MPLKTEKLAKLIVTFFYLGYVPFMPGTFGTLAGTVIFLFLGHNSAACILSTMVITLLGFIYCGSAEKIFSRKDPSCVIIDEVSGMLFCYCFFKISLFNVIGGFILFRIFDIAKPFYIRNLEKLKGSVGIMLDDLVAGAYAVIALKTIHYLVKILAG